MDELNEVQIQPLQSFRSDRCRRCGRVLKTPESMELGYGPTCYKKFLQTSHMKKLIELEGIVNDDRPDE